jgi:DNA-binding MarR family transcriptional regulator
MSTETSDQRQRLLAALRDTSLRLSTHYGFYTDAVASRLGLNRIDVDCLALLSMEGPITAGRLADLTGFTTGGVSGVLDRLERAGFVQREVDPDDRRRVIVRIVPEQIQRLIPLSSGLQQAMDRVYAESTDGELATLLEHARASLRIVQEETAQLRIGQPEGAAAEQQEGGAFSSPFAGETAGTLVFSGGANALTIRTERGMGDLFRARFERGEVTVRASDGTVTIESRRWQLFQGRVEGEVVLNPAIPWAVRIRGGASRIDARLADVSVSEVELLGGLSNAEFTFGTPPGTVPIRVTGGASRLAFHRPAGVPMRLQVRGGVSDVRVDDQHLRGASGLNWESPGYASATGKYDLSMRGGLSRLTVDTGATVVL